MTKNKESAGNPLTLLSNPCGALAFFLAILLAPSLGYASEATVDAPEFAAPTQSFTTPVQTGTARAAHVPATGLYQRPEESGPLYCLGQELPESYERLVFVRAVDDFYAGGNVLWTGELEFDGEPGQVPAPPAQGYVTTDGQYFAVCKTERDEVFEHNYLKECAPNWYFGRAYDIVGVRKNKAGEKELNPVIVEVEVPAPASEGKAVLRVALNSNAPKDKENQLRITINGAVVAEAVLWNDPGYRIITVDFDAALLEDGANEVELLGDRRYVRHLDWVEITTPATPRLADGALTVRSDGNAKFDLPGAKYALDISEFGHEQALPEEAAEKGAYGLEADHLYYFANRFEGLEFGAEQKLALPGLEDVDYLCLGLRANLPALEPLLEEKRAQGLSTAVAAFEDVTNVYNGGMYGPDGIVHMLEQFTPEYLLIAGGFDRDSRGRQENHAEDAAWHPGIPAQMRQVEQLTVTDDCYMLDYTVKVGRVPLNSESALRAWATKATRIQATDKLILLAGRNEKLDFSAMQQNLVRRFPSALLTSDEKPQEEIRSALFELMETESNFVAYQGHAQSWELDKGLLGPGDAAAMPLSNWVLATCNAGYYHADYEVYLRDWMAAPEGGCVNALASASVGSADQQDQLVRRVQDFLRDEPGGDWGTLMHFLKKNLPFRESLMNDPELPAFISKSIPKDRMTIDAYSLFGDPAAPVLASEPRSAKLVRNDEEKMNSPLPAGPVELALDLQGAWNEKQLEAGRIAVEWSPRNEEDWKPLAVTAPLQAGKNAVPFDSSGFGQDGGIFQFRVVESHGDLPATLWDTVTLRQESYAPGVPELRITLRKPAQDAEERVLFAMANNREIVHGPDSVQTQFQVRAAAEPARVLVETAWQQERWYMDDSAEKAGPLEIRVRWKKNGIEGAWSDWVAFVPPAEPVKDDAQAEDGQ